MYYVVSKGKQTGIFNGLKTILKIHADWEQELCIQSFPTLKEARQYAKKTQVDSKVRDGNRTRSLVTYVDGSYNASKKLYGIGIVVLQDDIVILEKALSIPKQSNEPQLHEWFAFYEGLKWSNQIRYDQLYIYTDCSTIYQMFHTKQVKIKKKFNTIVEQIRKEYKSQKMEVRFSKSHQGLIYNERADQLAKIGCGIKGVKNQPSSIIRYKNNDVQVKQIANASNALNKKIGLNQDNYTYILELIHSIPMPQQGLEWELFSNALYRRLVQNKKTFKIKKLKTYEPFLKEYTLFLRENTSYIKRAETRVI